MKVKLHFLFRGVLLLLGITGFLPRTFAAQTSSEESEPLESVGTLFIQSGEIKSYLVKDAAPSDGMMTLNFHHLQWMPDGKTLLVDMNAPGKPCGIYMVSPDAAKAIPVVSSSSGANGALQQFAPSLSADGKWLLSGIQLNTGLYVRPLTLEHGFPSDLMLTDLKNPRKSWRLTQNTSLLASYSGVQDPCFSPVQNKIFWTELVSRRIDPAAWGQRQLAVADLVFDEKGKPYLANKQVWQPVVQGIPFCRSYGFSPDGKEVIFSANLTARQDWANADLAVQSLDPVTNRPSGEIRPLTQSLTSWDQYPSYSPRGEKITWSSSRGYEVANLGVNGALWQYSMVSELWIMNRDGSDKKQLTFFNNSQHPHYWGTSCYVGASAWHPDGKRIAMLVYSINRIKQVCTSVVILTLEDRRPAPEVKRPAVLQITEGKNSSQEEPALDELDP